MDPILHTERLGAYGLWLDPPVASSSLVLASDEWPAIELRRQRGHSRPGGNHIDDEQARFCFADGGGLHVDATARQAVLTSPQPISDAELVHPYLAPVAAAFAWWAHREAFHAGAFAVEGRAWALVGDKGQGKSSMLAWLAQTDHAIVCDDMLVIDSGMALAGPRCVDLRSSAALQMGVGELTMRAPEPRWRIALPMVPPASPLAGWIFLAWGDAVDAVPVGGPALLRRLASSRSMLVAPKNPTQLLDLATLPAWELRMPRDWSKLPLAAERLLGLTVEA